MVIRLTNNVIPLISVIVFLLLSIFSPVRFGAELDLLIIPCAILLIGYFTAKRRITKSNFNVYIFFICVFFSTGISKYVPIMSDMLSFFVLCSAFFLYSSIEWDKEEIQIIIKTYMFFSFLAAIVIVYNWLRGNFSNVYFQRATIIINQVYKDENYVMGFVVPGIVFTLYYFLFNNSLKKRIIYGAVLICELFAVFAAGSRGGMLSILLAVVFSVLYFFISGRSIKTTVLFMLLIAVAILVVVCYILPLLPDSYINRLSNLSENVRLIIWAKALESFKGSNVIFGGGLHFANNYTYSTLGYYTHNLYLNILLDFGLLGTLSFIFCLVVPNLVMQKQTLLVMCALSIGFFLPLFFLNGFNSSAFFTPFIILNIIKKFSEKYGQITEIFKLK